MGANTVERCTVCNFEAIYSWCSSEQTTRQSLNDNMAINPFKQSKCCFNGSAINPHFYNINAGYQMYTI